MFSKGNKSFWDCLSTSSIWFFFKISGTDILGLVDVSGCKNLETYPEIGSTIEAVVLQFRDSENPLKRHFRLGVNISTLKGARFL